MLRPPGAPGKIVCIGLNYRKHAEESGAPLPKYPMLFSKWTTALTDPNADIPLPAESSLVDWERGLSDGDVYEVEIEGIGRLRNRFVAEAKLGS